MLGAIGCSSYLDPLGRMLQPGTLTGWAVASLLRAVSNVR
jgi:hypothetical protein